MKKLLVFMAFFCFSLHSAKAAEEENYADENFEQVGEVFVHSGYVERGEIVHLELSKEEDDFYTDATVKPLDKSMSKEEKVASEASDVLSLKQDEKLEDLECSNANLKKQIEEFIYQNLSKNNTRSVIEKRLRILLVKNLQNFTEITQDKISGKNKFEANAIIMELKINKQLPIYRICESKGNEYNKFESVYAIIYQDMGYYKVVISNLAPTVETIDEATFIYNW